MKPRTTLLLATIACGIFAYIWFVERHTESTRESADSNARVLALEANDITAITIQNGDNKLDLQKAEGVWKITHPLADRADSALIQTLLTSLESLRHSSKIEISPAQEKEKFKEFGVAESDLHLKLKSDSGKTTELLLGKDSAIDRKIYVRQQGSNTVYVINSSLRTYLSKKNDDFRDTKLSDIPSQHIQRLSIKTQEGELELERKNNHWEIVKPLRARAADQKVNDLIAGVLNAKVSQFYSETPTPEQGLGEPRALITLNIEGKKSPVTLKVGTTPTGEANKEKSFTRLSDRPAVTVLANSALDPLLKARPNDVRDRKLVRVENDIIDRITIEADGQPKLVMTRKGEGWVQKDNGTEIKINESIPAKILATVQATHVTNFITDIASDLAQYGLEKPKLKLTFSSYASENTAETQAGDRPIASVLFGNTEGDSSYVKLEDEPFVVAAPRAFGESLPTHRIHLQPLNVASFKTEDITSIEVTKAGSSIKLDRKENKWKSTDANRAINETNVASLLTNLSNLKTNRWQTPQEAGEQSTDSPELALNLTLKDGSSVTIQVIRPLGEEGFISKISTSAGFFFLSKKQYAQLDLNLID